MDEWTHVDDRLPDTNDRMFIFVQCPGYKDISGLDTGWLHKGRWVDYDCDLEFSEEYGDEIIKHVVTHWSPYVIPSHPTTGILE